ncbi:MAG: hypothetical protein MI864_09805 [Pseudomonadales bacterium]|nr:hypothetical protein [Pseudomonadales bacterium]
MYINDSKLNLTDYTRNKRTQTSQGATEAEALDKALDSRPVDRRIRPDRRRKKTRVQQERRRRRERRAPELLHPETAQPQALEAKKGTRVDTSA